MNFILEEFVELQTFEWFEHFFYHFLQIFYKRLVFNLDCLLRDQNIFLLDTLLLFVSDLNELWAVIVFGFQFALAKVYHLPKLC